MTTPLQFIGNDRFLIQHSPLDSGVTAEQLKELREFALQSWDHFLELLDTIRQAQNKRFGKDGSYRGYEVVGHGVSVFGSSFRLGDYIYVEEIFSPALRKFFAEKPKGWPEFWKRLTSTEVSPEMPVALKRALVPLLIDKINDRNHIDILREFLSIRKGIPHITDIIFEQLSLKQVSIPAEIQLDFLNADIADYRKDAEHHWNWYFRTIFSFRILFSLYTHAEKNIREQAQEIAYNWLSEFTEKLFDIQRTTHFDCALDILLQAEDTELLEDVVLTLLTNHVDELNSSDSAINPLYSLKAIINSLLLTQPKRGKNLVHRIVYEVGQHEYVEKLLAYCLQELSGNEANLPLVHSLLDEYRGTFSMQRIGEIMVEIADKYSQSESPEERERAYAICMDYLRKGLTDQDRLAAEYLNLNESMTKKDQGTVFAISGIEGRSLFIIHRHAKEHPEEIYKISLDYWLNTTGVYLKYMAAFPLHASIHYLVHVPEGEGHRYDYDRARGIFRQCFSDGLSSIKHNPYNLPCLWHGINRMMATLRPILTFEEVQAFLELGEDREDTHWVLPYYARFAKEYVWKKWGAKQLSDIRKQFDDYLATPGNEEEIAQLLTDMRNRILEGFSSQEDVDICAQLIETRKNRHFRVISTMGHILIDAAKKKDDKYLPIVPMYYKKWIIPFILEMPKNAGFVYIPRTKEVLTWYAQKESKNVSELACSLIELPSEWQERIFQDLNLSELVRK
ncbi:TPA: hypothetical protein DCL30_03780 [Candidatus Peribacteria bacterium]|nr:MAG: hypothetical protein A3J91_00535 [Candidatus Peribacteria bacterium RIFOXYC2_FULL_58_10]OGJ84830.1 MAG: hypothetical protein A2529_00730 [Candidatus Peribacteria bacterium RIFOXYD2_FULL_58_15]HAI98625.1 hypothetical protein [Candidatus Peribacteria bacterium]HAS34338.1 hypothetical protein [Candidatus Peribacteria bacterium]